MIPLPHDGVHDNAGDGEISFASGCEDVQRFLRFSRLCKKAIQTCNKIIYNKRHNNRREGQGYDLSDTLG